MTGITLLVTHKGKGRLFKQRHSGKEIGGWLEKFSANGKIEETRNPKEFSLRWAHNQKSGLGNLQSPYAENGYPFTITSNPRDPGAVMTQANEELDKLNDNMACSYADHEYWIDLDRKILLKRTHANGVETWEPKPADAKPAALDYRMDDTLIANYVRSVHSMYRATAEAHATSLDPTASPAEKRKKEKAKKESRTAERRAFQELRSGLRQTIIDGAEVNPPA